MLCIAPLLYTRVRVILGRRIGFARCLAQFLGRQFNLALTTANYT